VTDKFLNKVPLDTNTVQHQSQPTMPNIQTLNVDQLRKILAIKEEIETLQSQLNSIAGEGPQTGGEMPAPSGERTGKKRRKVSAAGRARIAAAARARWARVKAEAAAEIKPAKKVKRRLSRAGKAAIIAATKARWARVRAAQQAAA
jgi:peptidoglycan hydrolase CwlO-like protein